MTPSALPEPGARDFSWEDGDRLIRFGEVDPEQAAQLLVERDLFPWFVLVGGSDRVQRMDAVLRKAAGTVRVPSGPVPQAAAAVRDPVAGHSLVAIGGGRVIDSAKAIAGADGLRCAAIPTTLSGAEMTPFHRMPAGVEQFSFVRPELVLAVPSLMASQPMPDLAASAVNALAHAVEALYTPMAEPHSDEAGLRAAGLIAGALETAEPARRELALGALLAGYASGVAGFAVHHAVCQTIVRLCGTPHAQTNAVMLPRFVRLMEPRAPEAIGRVAAALGAKGARGAGDRVAELAARAEVTGLGELGVQPESLDAIVRASLEHPALGNTPDPPDANELGALLGRSL